MEMNSKKRLAKHLKDFTNIGTALSTESDINKFFQLVLNAAIEFTNCDGGTIYLISEKPSRLNDISFSYSVIFKEVINFDTISIYESINH